jgi:CBS domain-containing protein
MDEGELAGIVSLQDARRVGPAARETRTVLEIMTPARDLESVSPDDGAFEALQKLARRDVDQLPVLENGELRGVIRRDTILKWVSLHAKSDGPEASFRIGEQRG